MDKLKGFITDYVLLMSGILIGAFLQTNPNNIIGGFSVIYFKYIIPSILLAFALAIIFTKNR